jgi:hypothetical protein
MGIAKMEQGGRPDLIDIAFLIAVKRPVSAEQVQAAS